MPLHTNASHRSTPPRARRSRLRRTGATLVAAGALAVVAAFPAAAQDTPTEVTPPPDPEAVTEEAPDEVATAGEVAITAVTLDVNPTTIQSGGSLQFTVGTLPANQGVYVNFCEDPADAGVRTQGAGLRCAPVGGDEAMPGMSGFWVVNPGQIPYPGLEFGEGVQASGTAVTMGPIPSSFSGVDCAVVTCGVYAIRDHRGLADTSLDTFVPVSFGTTGGGGEGGPGAGGVDAGGAGGVGAGVEGAGAGGAGGVSGTGGSALADTGVSNGLLAVIGSLSAAVGLLLLVVARRPVTARGLRG